MNEANGGKHCCPGTNVLINKCDEIKSLAPQAAGPRTVVVPIKETPRKKNELPYDFLDD